MLSNGTNAWSTRYATQEGSMFGQALSTVVSSTISSLELCFWPNSVTNRFRARLCFLSFPGYMYCFTFLKLFWLLIWFYTEVIVKISNPCLRLSWEISIDFLRNLYVFVILYWQTVTAAASVAWVAACRALVETRRVNVFMSQEWRRLADETVKREAQVRFAPMPSKLGVVGWNGV